MADETPSVRTWIRDHRLAHEIMYRTDDGITPPTGGRGQESKPPNGVMDDGQLDLLERFVSYPTSENKIAMLKELGMVDAIGEKDYGKRAAEKGSLAAFIIASFETERPALTNGEIKELREWFASGRGISK
jgi:hypothetical protein